MQVLLVCVISVVQTTHSTGVFTSQIPINGAFNAITLKAHWILSTITPEATKHACTDRKHARSRATRVSKPAYTHKCLSSTRQPNIHSILHPRTHSLRYILSQGWPESPVRGERVEICCVSSHIHNGSACCDGCFWLVQWLVDIRLCVMQTCLRRITLFIHSTHVRTHLYVIRKRDLDEQQHDDDVVFCRGDFANRLSVCVCACCCWTLFAAACVFACKNDCVFLCAFSACRLCTV